MDVGGGMALMEVVGWHGWRWWDGIDGGGWMALMDVRNKARRSWSLVGSVLPECEVKTLITPPSRCTALGRVEPKLVSLPGKAFTLGAMRGF